MQQIQLNIIPITPVSNTLTFSFFGEKFPKSASIKWDKLFDEFPEGRAADKQSYYFSPVAVAHSLARWPTNIQT